MTEHLVPTLHLCLLLDSFHEKAIRHPGIAKMLQEIRCRSYYPSYAKIVKKGVEVCEICIKHKQISNASIATELLNLPEWTLGPEDTMQRDLLPNVPPSGGYENIITAMISFKISFRLPGHRRIGHKYSKSYF